MTGQETPPAQWHQDENGDLYFGYPDNHLVDLLHFRGSTRAIRAAAYDALVAAVTDTQQLRDERDALLAMVECCRELVPEISELADQDALAAIVGWPPPARAAVEPTPTTEEAR